jgi:hypothetical protein
MNKYVKEYLIRGLIFGGFGPVLTGIVLLILDLSGVAVVLSGADVCIAVISTYILAFVHSGSSVFNQIEGWPIAKSLAFHFASLYLVYVLCYLINRWIPLNFAVIGIFTLSFVVIYFAIWLTVYLIIKNTTKKLNSKVG